MAERLKPGEYRIRGTGLTRSEKLTRAEKLRLEENRERRTPRCIRCLEPRDSPRSDPICPKCRKA